MRRCFAAAVTAAALTVTGCSGGASTVAENAGGSATSTNALRPWQADAGPGTQRIVVISDIHLGVDDAFGETVKNKALLTDFLRRAAASDIDELVIAGDFLDEWFLPATYAPHTESRAFYRRVRENNAQVFTAFQELMTSGTTLTYVPGNHDMLLDEKTLNELLPGIEQSRDADGLGMHRTGARSEITIEHGHRYDAGAAPDSLSNRGAGAQVSILPVGYFVTRIIATAVSEGKSALPKPMPQFPKPTGRTDGELDVYAYREFWSRLMASSPIQASMDDAIFHAEFGGYDDPVSLRDLVPTGRLDGSMARPLYQDLPQRWEDIQAVNGVVRTNPFSSAITAAFNHGFLDQQAHTQHFEMAPQNDVVVFGHSHVPLVDHFVDAQGRTKTYANSGTWIDHNLLGPTGTFVVIDSSTESTNVRAFQYQPGGTVLPVLDTQ